MKKLNWKTLDKCESSSEIAQLLAKHGIKGIPGKPWGCPLAKATGSRVGNNFGWKRMSHKRDSGLMGLTSAEWKFVCEFDSGFYPELEATF